MTLTVGSLFSGIGGLDLGLERASMQVIWQSEIDPYCNKVLKKHWPKVPNHGDIKQIEWRNIERPNIICGGYPCQPFSVAGQRNGANDPRHLWPWVRTAISELRPDYAILENVRGHVTMGLSEVCGDLAAIGYDAEWQIVSAAALGAPHLRERLFIIAYPTGNVGYGRKIVYNSQTLRQRRKVQAPFGGMASPTDGSTTTELLYGPGMGRAVNGLSDRVDRLKGLGNAVVPQVAEYIGHLVLAAHNNS